MKIILIGYIVLMFGLNGCKDEDNPVQNDPGINSIEEQINSIRPIKNVRIYNYNGNGNSLYYSSSINDAFASRGFLIIITNSENLYFNLSRVVSIETHANEIRLQY